MDPKRASDAALEYTAADCAAAVSAMPEGHKAEYYLALCRACRAEQAQRERIRSSRRVLAHDGPNDPLAHPDFRNRLYMLRRAREIAEYARENPRSRYDYPYYSGALFDCGWRRHNRG